MKASHVHLTPLRISVVRSEERVPHLVPRRSSPSLARAAIAGGEFVEGHVPASGDACRTWFDQLHISLRFLVVHVSSAYRHEDLGDARSMEHLRAGGRVACNARASRACLSTAVSSCVKCCMTVSVHCSGVHASLPMILGVLSVSIHVRIA